MLYNGCKLMLDHKQSEKDYVNMRSKMAWGKSTPGVI